MEITIDLDGPEPLFSQLIDQIKTAVQKGALKPGDPLPSIRQLSNDLGINSKTVAKAYRLLERDSVVQSRGYRGTFIHSEAKQNSKIDLKEVATVQLEQTIQSLKGLGVTDSEIRNAFVEVMQQSAWRG